MVVYLLAIATALPSPDHCYNLKHNNTLPSLAMYSHRHFWPRPVPD